jgi:FKBP-type peptidyl-prolyl cis-trans isomerase FkpA/FKBP-type peptidyl-prolyl cis-trans isomerase FklB
MAKLRARYKVDMEQLGAKNKAEGAAWLAKN